MATPNGLGVMRRLGIDKILVGAMVAALIASMPASGPAEEPSTVGVDTVREETLAQTVPVIGRLVSRRTGVVAAREEGPLLEIQVDVGDRVAAGDVIAVLDRDRLAASRDLRAAEVGQARAQVQAAEAEWGLRQQELKRIEGLKQSPAFSRGAYDDKRQEVMMAEGDREEAAAALARAEAQLRLNEIALRDTEILAPYPGVVSRRHTEVGAHIDVGDPIVTLVDDSRIEMEADVPVDRVSGLVPGTPVAFKLNTAEMTATVRAVVPDENPRTRTRLVRFVPDLKDTEGLAANQSVTVWVPAGKARSIVTVHKDALLHDRGETYVFLVTDGAAERRPVRLGEAQGSRIEVLDGLAAGDRVVVRGNERLRPGQAVRFLKDLQG